MRKKNNVNDNKYGKCIFCSNFKQNALAMESLDAQVCMSNYDARNRSEMKENCLIPRQRVEWDWKRKREREKIRIVKATNLFIFAALNLQWRFSSYCAHAFTIRDQFDIRSLWIRYACLRPSIIIDWYVNMFYFLLVGDLIFAILFSTLIPNKL